MEEGDKKVVVELEESYDVVVVDVLSLNEALFVGDDSNGDEVETSSTTEVEVPDEVGVRSVDIE